MLRRADGSIVRVQYRLAPAELGPDRLMVAAWWPEDEEDMVAEAAADDEGVSPDAATHERVLGLAF